MADLTREAQAVLGPKRPCSCGAEPGERHSAEGCDIARCRQTGQQWIQCEGEIHDHKGREYGEHKGECGPDIWTGWYPGSVEAAERGWFSYFGPPWIPCGPDHPQAQADISRVIMELRWNPATGRYEDRG